MQGKILSCFWKENILSRHRKKKQNKDCPALEHKLYSKQGKKKSFSSQHEQFLLQTYAKSMQSQLKYLPQESSDTFYTFALKSQHLQVSKGLENIPFHYPLHLFHLLRSELHWLYSLPAHSMFHLTFRLPNSPVHHIVVGYLLEQQNVTKDSEQV